MRHHDRVHERLHAGPVSSRTIEITAASDFHRSRGHADPRGMRGHCIDADGGASRSGGMGCPPRGRLPARARVCYSPVAQMGLWVNRAYLTRGIMTVQRALGLVVIIAMGGVIGCSGEDTSAILPVQERAKAVEAPRDTTPTDLAQSADTVKQRIAIGRYQLRPAFGLISSIRICNCG